MATLIASGTAAAESAEFTLASSDVVTLSLFSASDPEIPDLAQGVIMMKTSGSFIRVGFLDQRTPALALSAPGTYKVIRRECKVAFGVDKV